MTPITILAAVCLLPATASAREANPTGLPRSTFSEHGRVAWPMLAAGMGLNMPSLVAEEASASRPSVRLAARGDRSSALKSGRPPLSEFWLGHRLPAAPSNDRAVSLPGDGGARLSDCCDVCVPGLHAQKVAMEIALCPASKAVRFPALKRSTAS